MDRAVGQQDEIDYQAAAWLAALECGTADRGAFEQWRANSAAHALAFIRAAQLSDSLALLRDASPEAGAAVADSERGPTTSRRKLLKNGALAALCIGAGVAGWSLTATARNARTEVGERRRIVIADGISVELNTDSHIRWDKEKDRYDVELVQGELLIERRSGSARCTVHCADTHIEPALARVNARLNAGTVEVAVLSGTALIQGSASASPTRIESGRWTNNSVKGSPRIAPLSVEEIDAIEAWPRGELQFNGERLADAVREYNRYLARPIVIADPAIGELRLGGRFSSTDPGDFLNALNTIYQVQAHMESRRIRLSRT